MPRTALALVVAVMAAVSMLESNGITTTETTVGGGPRPTRSIDDLASIVSPLIDASEWSTLELELRPLVDDPDAFEPDAYAAAVSAYKLAVAHLAEGDPAMMDELVRLVETPPKVTFQGDLPPEFEHVRDQADSLAREVVEEG